MKRLIACLFLLNALQVFAQDPIQTKITIAGDISPYAFNGYSGKIGILAKSIPNMDIAVEVFSMTIPDAVINMNSENASQNWSEKVNFGTALYVDRKLGEKRNSFWAGGGVVYLNQTATNPDETNEYAQLEYLMRINYKWFPFEKYGFYINPYCAVAFRHKISGDAGGYALTPALLIPSVYLSWEL